LFAQTAYYTGNGGKGISIAVLRIDGVGIKQGSDDAVLLSMIQGDLTADFQKYSAMTVIDRQNLDKVMGEIDFSEKGYTTDKNAPEIGKMLNANTIVSGTLTRTRSGYVLELAATNVEKNKRVASYGPKACSYDAIYYLTAVKSATADLLGQLGVQLTDAGRAALSQVNDLKANAQAMVAKANALFQKDPTSIEALAYYNQAQAYDPSLAEAVNRSQIMTASISTGSIGADARNKIKWYNQWKARLTETENYYANFFNTFFQTYKPYALVYTVKDLNADGNVSNLNYQRQTESLTCLTVQLLQRFDWTPPIQKTLAAVRKGLLATGMAREWGFADWPRSEVTGSVPLNSNRGFHFVVELVNKTTGKVLGTQDFNVGAWWRINDEQTETGTDNQRTITFDNVNVNDMPDRNEDMTIRFTSVNNTPVNQMGTCGLAQIVLRDQYRDTDGYDINGYDRQGYKRDGYNDAGYDKEGFDRQGYDKNGYKRDGYNDAGYNKNGYDINGHKYGMVPVPAGTFMMGSDLQDGEQPVHRVTISSPFYMCDHEVTQGEWQSVMGSNPSSFKKGDNYPVEQVSWYDAVAYCNKRSIREGLTPCYNGSGNSITCDFSANGYRLPTEAEWEWAAKGGGKGNFDSLYSGGNIADSVAWYDANSGGSTHPVKTKQPNSLGLYDMSGNVWEWCWDWYGPYSSGSQTDPARAASGTYRVLRGGSWYDGAGYCRSSYRFSDFPDGRLNYYGFRVCRSH
jgi:formylglycine-generating enzyme required for sulfatase activity/TolB-like protein